MMGRYDVSGQGREREATEGIWGRPISPKDLLQFREHTGLVYRLLDAGILHSPSPPAAEIERIPLKDRSGPKVFCNNLL